MDLEAEPLPRRRSTLRTVIVATVMVVGLLVVVGFAVSQESPDPAPPGSGFGTGELEGRPEPDEQFALPPETLEGFAGGPDVDLGDYRGQPLVVNFWATWCAPCVREMPEFQTVSEEAGDAVTFLGIDVEDAPANAEPFVERLGITYPLALDRDRSFSLQIGNYGMPTTLFVDPDGIVRYRYTGALEAQQLRDLIAEHLQVEI